jgi:hypothetical protein
MKWIDVDHEMKWFAKERNVKYNPDGVKYREFNLYNVRSGTIFCTFNLYDDGSYKIETLDFFDVIKDELYTLIMKNIVTGEAYSYDKWILPLFRNKKLNEIGI